MMSLRHVKELARRVRRQIALDTADLVAFASELIAIPSENPPGTHYSRCASHIARRLRELDLEVRTVNPTGKGPCVAGSFGEGGRALYFSGHYDVVPAQDRAQFKPVVRKANLHGRGSADMKGGIAAMAFAIRALARSGFEPKGRVISVSVPDEETSGSRGTVALVKSGFVEPDAIGMLTMEPTGGVVWNANRGVISMRVSVRGKPAHVGLHFRGRNACRGMLTVAGMLGELEGEVSQRRTDFRINPEAARRSTLLLGGELSGGHNFNVVPDRVSFTLDRRTNPEENFDEERDRLQEVVEKARTIGVACDVDIMQEGRSAATAAGSPLGRALATGIRGVTGRGATFELCPPNEFVSVAKLVQCAEVHALTAMRLLA
jgi:succinyl-diaminopimelate desuccinylase